MKKSSIKGLFLGDHLTRDVVGAVEDAKWDGIMVIEDMNYYIKDSEKLYGPHHLYRYDKYWGGYFWDEVDDENGKKKEVKNFFVDEASKRARYAIPSVLALARM